MHNPLIHRPRLLAELFVATRKMEQRSGAHIAGSRSICSYLQIGRDSGFEIAIHLLFGDGAFEFYR